MKPKIRCPLCDRANMVEQEAELTGTRNGEAFIVTMAALVCPKCQHKTISKDKMGEYALLVSDAYRKKHGLMTSHEIRSARKRLQMSQDHFARYLGVGVASVKRWELGLIQDAAMNELMTLKTDRLAAQRNAQMVAAKHGDFAGVVVDPNALSRELAEVFKFDLKRKGPRYIVHDKDLPHLPRDWGNAINC